jgi:Fe-S cluster biogenesis protein NfuA
MDPGLRMHAERTPNPDSLKWVLTGQTLLEPGSSAHFPEPVAAEISPLAARLFGVDGIEGVFLAPGFVTVTKRTDLEWADLAQDLVDAIHASLESGEGALGPGYVAPALDEGGETVQRIRRILDHEIRPAVAMDGGDIVFAGFRDGIVELYLQGSCQGCPSATATLKLGIERRLMEEIPEVLSVEAL